MKTTDNQNEIFDIVNEKDNIIGQATRGEVHKNKNLIHRSIGLAVLNSKGEIFLQQRSATKDTDPLKWTISCSGHVLSSEDYEETVLRELKEELRLDIISYAHFFVQPKKWAKERPANANFLVSLTLGNREETSRMQSSGTPHLCRSARETNKNLQRQIIAHSLRETTPKSKRKLSIEPVCKYLCRTPNETEMVMLYKAEIADKMEPCIRFHLSKEEIIQGKFFTRKELLEALISEKIELSFWAKVALEKLGWI